MSLTPRVALLAHEASAGVGAALPVAIGAPIPFADLAPIRDRQALADHLRERVYALAGRAPAVASVA